MKILPCGVAVVEGDTHIGKWVEQEGRLDIARNMIEPFKKWIPKGGVVVDAGASIGDHTVTYAELVGPEGRVWAFEPDPSSYECLKYNMRFLTNVILHDNALSDKSQTYQMIRSPNVGASWVVPSEYGSSALTVRLDSCNLQRLNFLKIDVEGMECHVLGGATVTIDRCHPAILCEVYEGALERAGSSKKQLFDLIEQLGYGWQMVDLRFKQDDPFYDIFCTPLSLL